MKRIAIIILAFALSACAADDLKNRREKLAGKPEAYKDGYVDGCSSGNQVAGSPYYPFQKDPQRFESDKMYAQGWGDGFTVCKGELDYIHNYYRR